jgi:hypothetical protein
MEEKFNTPADENPVKDREASAEHDCLAPGVPIVRTSTPRPMPLLMPAKTELPLAPSVSPKKFPAEAPDAPPLPEEPAGTDEIRPEQALFSTPHPGQTSAESGAATLSRPPASEFIWLFEYALDMDPVRLNRPERLNGSAFAYGPASLKGYQLAFEGLDTHTGHVIASLHEARDQPEAEVWGVLYRVPGRFSRGEAGEAPLLDKVHCADTFVSIEVQVREPYRQRMIHCVTYIASEVTRKQVSQLVAEERLPEPAYCKRLLQAARRQKLPMNYLHELEDLVPTGIPAAIALPTTPPEQNTEPLPALVAEKNAQRETDEVKAATRSEPRERHSISGKASERAGIERWLMVFACYISLLVVGTLVLAVFQGLGFWREVFNDAFTPLGVPWYVLLYGLLGGCISCVIALGRSIPEYPPGFVVMTWFIRPFLGALLGAFAYLLLNSGAILLSSQGTQHFALCSVAGVLAGLCEGKLLAIGKGWRTSA